MALGHEPGFSIHMWAAETMGGGTGIVTRPEPFPGTTAPAREGWQLGIQSKTNIF